MLELVADMAPGAKLTFATAAGGKAQMAANIYTLANSYACRIIVDDFTYANEAAFQEDVVANAVTYAVSQYQIMFFSSAGNSGRANGARSGTWEGDYVNGGRNGMGNNFVHNFGPQLYATLNKVGQALALQWSDPYGGSANDFDLYMTNSAGDTLLDASTNVQSGTQDPYELIACDLKTSVCSVGVRVYIIAYAVQNARALRLDAHRGEIFPSTGGSIYGHNGGINTISVAAVPTPTNPKRKFTTIDAAETYSSDGPRRLFLNPVPDKTPITANCYLYSCNGGTTLQKPDIAAGDCVSTSVTSPSGFNPFCGTSAAAPHAAAIAQLIKSRAPILGPPQILARMKATAIDIGAPGVDRDAGYGIVMADAAVLGAWRTWQHDFSGDGKSDILWRNTSGEAGIWMMNGASVTSTPSLGTIPNNWAIVGQRDFDGDGKSDILWLNSAGDIGIWFMNGAAATSTPVLGNVGTSWKVVGTGDFNSDSRGDLLWRNTAGDLGIWLMNGTSYTAVTIGNVPLNWSVVGTGDFNGDGRWDILWRSSANDIGIWFMNGTSVTATVTLGNVGSTWSVAGLGDFDKDGKTDILWRSSSNDIGIWMNTTPPSTTQASYTVAGLGNVGPTWAVATIGDFNGDGKSDIVWRSSSNDIGIWMMKDATVASAPIIGSAPSAWQVQNAASN